MTQVPSHYSRHLQASIVEPTAFKSQTSILDSYTAKGPSAELASSIFAVFVFKIYTLRPKRRVLLPRPPHSYTCYYFHTFLDNSTQLCLGIIFYPLPPLSKYTDDESPELTSADVILKHLTLPSFLGMCA
jgi:hypothetical protein